MRHPIPIALASLLALASPATARPHHRGGAACSGLDSCRSRCDDGDGNACDTLGSYYQNGTNGAEQDQDRAFELYERACDDDSGAGCTDAGFFTENGMGTERNLRRALRYYRQACEGGNALGCVNQGLLLQKGGDDIDVDDDQALRLFQRGCSAGNAGGCNALGWSYQNGRGVDANYARAAQLYDKACRGGSPPGCENAGLMYRDGLGVDKDAARANQLFAKACSAGQNDACTMQVAVPPPPEPWLRGTMRPDDIDRVVAQMQGQFTEKGRIQIARDLASSGQQFSAAQVAQLMVTCYTDTSRIEIAAALWPRVVDKQDFFKVSGALQWGNSAGNLRKKLGMK